MFYCFLVWVVILLIVQLNFRFLEKRSNRDMNTLNTLNIIFDLTKLVPLFTKWEFYGTIKCQNMLERMAPSTSNTSLGSNDVSEFHHCPS
jgi:hypothetical protein